MSEDTGCRNLISSYTVEDGIDDGHFTDLSRALRFFLREHTPEGFKFDPGQIVATIGIMKLIAVGTETAAGVAMHDVPALAPLLARHLRADWGDTDPDDAKLNDRSLAEQSGRLMSSYTLEHVKVWISTEPGITTILLPEEY